MNHNKHTLVAFLRRLALIRAVVVILGALGIAGLCNNAAAQKYIFTNIWFAPTNLVSSTNHIENGNNNRSMVYNPVAGEVYVCYKTTPTFDVLSAANGTYQGSANNTGIIGGTFTLNQLAVADDGIIYGMNLQQTISSGMKIYQWTNWQTAPAVSYSGDPSAGTLARRMGDNLKVKGSGTNTVLLAPTTSASGTLATTNVVLFSTTDGLNFTPTVLNIINIAAPPSGNNGPTIACCFYTNNTFLFMQGGSSLYLVQYPTNFASLGSPVNATAIATNSTLLSGTTGQKVLSYAPAGSLLAVLGPMPNAAPATDPISLYQTSSFLTPASVGTTNTAHTFANGNFVGGVALGGVGGTNRLFTMASDNGVYGWSLTYLPAPVSPLITTQPVGSTVYTNLGSYTFSITAGGTVPLVYYWQYNSVSNPATATTIYVATNSGTFTISNLTVASSGWYDCIVSNSAGTTNSATVNLVVNEPLASSYVTPLWSIAADGSQPYLDTSYNTRGLAYEPVSGTLLVAEHATTSIYALNPTNGSYMYTLTTPSSGLPNGSIFPLGQIGVADDGVLYACNVSSYNPTNSTAQSGVSDFSITRFSNVSDPAGTKPYSLYPAFTGDPGAASPSNPGVSSGDRWGDSMAVRGAGTNTQIILGTYETLQNGQFGTGSGTNVCILTTSDGYNFTPITIAVTNAPDGFAYLGVAWGSNNTFWAKSPGYNLREVQYDLNSGIGTVILSFATTASAGSLSAVAGIGLDVSNNILAGVNFGDTPNDLELFQIPSLGFPPQAYYQAFFPTNNPNINGNAATVVKFPYIFSLDANNGIIALKYSVPLLPFTIVQNVAANQQILTWQTIQGHTYQLEATNAIPTSANDWPHIGAPFVAPSNGTTSYTNTIPKTGNLFYRIVAQ
jgi:hypothetical protein